MSETKVISRSLLRQAAIAALFFVLFVSSGEGVRLFPIPVTVDVGAGSSESADRASGSYCIGIQTVRNLSASQRSKQVNDAHSDGPGVIPTFEANTLNNSFSNDLPTVFGRSTAFSSDPSVSQHSGRAPPIA